MSLLVLLNLLALIRAPFWIGWPGAVMLGRLPWAPQHSHCLGTSLSQASQGMIIVPFSQRPFSLLRVHHKEYSALLGSYL